MIFDPPARSRRRAFGRLLWPLLIVGAILVSLVVSSAGDETRAELEYLEILQSQASELAKDGEALNDLVSRLLDVERVEFETVIETISSDLEEARAFAEEDAPTGDLAATRSLYRQAVESWSDGIEEFGATVLTAADDVSHAGVIDNMAKALAELRAGDVLYADLVAELEREETPETLAPMPSVTLMPDRGRLVTLAVTYIDTARHPTNRLALRPGLGVSQIVSEPQWQVNPSEQAVVPSTDTIVFSVVVTNLGNVASGPGSMTLTLSGGAEPLSESITFAALDPNEQTTVAFSPMPVSPGGVYQVEAMLADGDAPDADLTDNVLTVQFRINE